MKTVRRNRPGEAVTAEAYQAFILRTIIAAGGQMDEAELDATIAEKYARFWGRTDRNTWGNVPANKFKWKQNVAAAKAGLDHRGLVIAFRYIVEKRLKTNPRKYRQVKRKARVYLGEHFGTIIAAVRQRDGRQRIDKPQYEQLRQPSPKYIVPN